MIGCVSHHVTNHVTCTKHTARSVGHLILNWAQLGRPASTTVHDRNANPTPGEIEALEKWDDRPGEASTKTSALPSGETREVESHSANHLASSVAARDLLQGAGTDVEHAAVSPAAGNPAQHDMEGVKARPLSPPILHTRPSRSRRVAAAVCGRTSIRHSPVPPQSISAER